MGDEIHLCRQLDEDLHLSRENVSLPSLWRIAVSVHGEEYEATLRGGG